ncbi:MAG: hypothetical protein KC431_05730, partial [Myxococcales bacterium]|nr:hypothetical protein [Myxococcales bacterium]
VHGPEKSLDALCGKVQAEVLASGGGKLGAASVQCELKPMVKDKPVLRALSKKQLNGGFAGAQLLQVGYVDQDYRGRLVLALETEAGWFWTDPLADLGNSIAGGVTVQTRSLVMRARELVAAPGREVVAELTVAVTDTDASVNEVAIDETSKVAVCSTGSPPTCILATLEWSSDRTLIDDKGDDPAKHPDLKSSHGQLFVAFLPEGRVSVSAPADSRPEERELVGIYAWPE